MSIGEMFPARAEVAPPKNRAEAEEQWSAERRTFIGGSEIYQLFNLPQYGKGCARQLAYEKLGREPEYELTADDEALMRRGHLLEPLVADLYEERTGRKVRRPSAGSFGFGKVRRHPGFPFLGVHTDRMILAGAGGIEQTGDLEIKTHAEGYFLQIMRKGLPAGHHLQLQHSLLVNQRTWGSLAMLGVFGSLPLEYADTTPDIKMQDNIKKEAFLFWNRLQRGILPDQLPDAQDMRCQICPFRKECRGVATDIAQAKFVHKNLSSDKQLVPITDPELQQDIKALYVLQQEIKTLDNDSEDAPGAIQLLENRIKTAFAVNGWTNEHKPYIAGEMSVAIMRSQFNGVDVARLKAEKPEIYEQYFVRNRYTGDVFFRLYPIKN